MSDWAQLKQQRAEKAPAASWAAPTAGTSASVTFRQHAQFHSEQVRVQQTLDRGRGIFVTRRITTGSTVIDAKPSIAVLDNRNLPIRCSVCYKDQSDLSESTKILSQCSLCHLVKYCSQDCQRSDWIAHKKECEALRAYSQAKGALAAPDSPVRALGRLLWAKERENSAWWNDIMSLESHRLKLDSARLETLYQLCVSLATYVGQNILLQACSNASACLDLCSAFVSNSFALTSPHFDSIGVAISPKIALINHSCAPNSVVVFPEFPHPNQSINSMRVVALRDLEVGEEILTSYIDIALPRQQRQTELLDRYNFTCQCSLCTRSSEWTDPRCAVQCAKEGCHELIGIPETCSRDLLEKSCPKCALPCSINVPEFRSVQVEAAQQLQLAQTEPDPKNQAKILRNSLSKMQNLRFAPSCFPCLATLQELIPLLITFKSWWFAMSAAVLLHSQALVLIQPSTFWPARTVALIALLKLRLAFNREDVQRDVPGSQDFLELPAMLELLEFAREAVRCVEGSLGKAGGVLLRDVRKIAIEVERQVAMMQQIIQR